MPDLFPNLFGEISQSQSAMRYDEIALTIQTLTNLAAACAVEGDIKLGRAFAQAVTPLIAIAMERWPAKNPAPNFEATKQAVEAASIESSTITEGTDMDPKDNESQTGGDNPAFKTDQNRDTQNQLQNEGGLDDRSGAADTTAVDHDPNKPTGAGTDGFDPNAGDGSDPVVATGEIDNSREDPHGTAEVEKDPSELDPANTSVEQEQVDRDTDALANRTDVNRIERGPENSDGVINPTNEPKLD